MENNLIQATVDYVHNLDWSDIFTNITSNKLLFLLSIAIPVIIPLFNIYKRIVRIRKIVILRVLNWMLVSQVDLARYKIRAIFDITLFAITIIIFFITDGQYRWYAMIPVGGIVITECCANYKHILQRIPFKRIKEFPYLKYEQAALIIPKGLVGILSTTLKEVKDIPANPRMMKIHFATTDESYETRQVITDKSIIERIIKNEIVAYYDSLTEKIREKGYDRSQFFYLENENGHKEFICDILKDIYSLENVYNAIIQVQSDITKDGSIRFIGDKVGIRGYKLEKGELLLDIYETDHFTFKVFKKIFKDRRFKRIFQEIICRTNKANDNIKLLLVESLAFLFSSFGIDIIIGGRDASGAKKMLVAARSGNIESDNRSTLHVPVNESFSRTDLVEHDQYYSPYHCVLRGIKEELGIPEEICKKTSVSFHDFAIVSDEGEIGLGCYVDFSFVMPLEEARLYPGQDKYLELADILIVPYPPFKWSPSAYEDYFYKTTGNEKFCMQWQSFTTLLYQRAILRNAEASIPIIWLVDSTIILTLLFLLTNYTQIDLTSTIISLILGGLALFIMKRFNNKPVHKLTYGEFLKPFVPQWNGDVRVLQSTMHSQIVKGSRKETNPIADGIMFGLNSPSGQKLKLSDIHLLTPPFCTVRREFVNFTEYPISFYYVAEKNGDIGNCLSFIKIPYALSSDDLSLLLTVKTEKGHIVSYNFTKPIHSDIILDFTNTLDEKQVNTFSKYYRMNKDLLKNVQIASLDENFQKRWFPLDLFNAGNDYFWSVIDMEDELEKHDSYDFDFKIGKKTQPRDLYMKVIAKNMDRSSFSIRLNGNLKDMETFLCAFTSRNDNRRKMSDLDIYMMQLFLIRIGIVYAKKK